MNENELNFNGLIGMILKNKIIFIVTNIILSVIFILYILSISLSYKSTLVYSLPLNKGVETQFLLNSLSELKQGQLNSIVGLGQEDIKILELNFSKAKLTNYSTLGNLDIITSQPDSDHIAKNSLTNYVSNISYIQKLIELNKIQNKDIIDAANKEYSAISENTDKVQFISSIELKEALHKYKQDETFINSIITLSYFTSTIPYKPNYKMLIVLSLFVAFICSLTIVLLKNIVASYKKSDDF